MPPPHNKTSGGREVIKELFYIEVESLATADPIQRGFVTTSQPHNPIEAEGVR